MKMRLKALLLFFLLAFASTSAVAIVMLNAAAPSIGINTTVLAASLGIIQPNGGDPVDNPIAPC